jgi:gamma-glutamylcyclotransferase (GGCT)/AIG2-like uncharacterized protein YtfP
MRSKVLSEVTRGARSRKTTRNSPPRQYLFVYGTLKRGGKFHRELTKEDVQFIEDARIRGELYRLRDSDFPGAVPTSAPNKYVHGQLFSLKNPEKTLAAMDDFEEVDKGLFRRKLVDVWTPKGQMKAWVYFYARPFAHSEPVPSGIYS